MELKEGMYVRTEKGIAKIIDRILEPDHYYFKMWVTDNYLEINDDTEYISEVDVLKASNNIIDLIEFGDVLIYKHPAFEKEYVERIDGKECLELRKNFFKEKSLKLLAIVTKEQLESMQYRVEEQ